ncbi:MAG: hypothetical protein AAGA83_12445 [Cyanobacteria bacterium P01_F01_bin.116]
MHNKPGQSHTVMMPEIMMYYLKRYLMGWLLALVLAMGLWTPAVQAAPLCRTVGEHQVCILQITRSAKYYWEYRAVVKVDDKRRPMGRYSCRTGEYISRNGDHVPDDIAAQVICAFFKR